MNRVEFDPNVRTRTNGTYVGAEEVPGLVPGDLVTLFEPEAEIEVLGTVERSEGGLVYLTVAWDTLRSL